MASSSLTTAAVLKALQVPRGSLWKIRRQAGVAPVTFIQSPGRIEQRYTRAQVRRMRLYCHRRTG
jgi:hypothetical protein